MSPDGDRLWISRRGWSEAEHTYGDSSNRSRLPGSAEFSEFSRTTRSEWDTVRGVRAGALTTAVRRSPVDRS